MSLSVVNVYWERFVVDGMSMSTGSLAWDGFVLQDEHLSGWGTLTVVCRWWYELNQCSIWYGSAARCACISAVVSWLDRPRLSGISSNLHEYSSDLVDYIAFSGIRMFQITLLPWDTFSKVYACDRDVIARCIVHQAGLGLGQHSPRFPQLRFGYSPSH
jgi:hypothetical protein